MTTSSGKGTARVLFVDDESMLRVTLPAILRMHGFEVTPTATVAEALAAIQSQPFDVLLADLNNGQPGDGFTVVSAMRRSQPAAVTLIITGYPTFETALHAIREQGDDYIVKPTDARQLVELIESKLRNRAPHQPIAPQPVSEILRREADSIVTRFLADSKKLRELAAARISDSERVAHLPDVRGELFLRLEARCEETSNEALHAAARHGETRRRQGYTIPMMYAEARCAGPSTRRCSATCW